MPGYIVVIRVEDKDYSELLIRSAFEYAMEMHNIKGRVVEVKEEAGLKKKSREYEDGRMYRRGRDYPIFRDGVKMAMSMTGKEVKEWFTEEELRDYPKPDAYTGPL